MCSPGALVTVHSLIAFIRKIQYYKGPVSTKSKFHITLGHETVMGRLSMFGLLVDNGSSNKLFQDLNNINLQDVAFDFSKDYVHQDELSADKEKVGQGVDGTVNTLQFALIELEKPVTCAANALLIGSRLDADVNTSSCRIAFYGRILVAMTDPKYKETVLPELKVFKVIYIKILVG